MHLMYLLHFFGYITLWQDCRVTFVLICISPFCNNLQGIRFDLTGVMGNEEMTHTYGKAGIGWVVSSDGTAIEAWKLRMFIIYHWTWSQIYSIQLNEEVGELALVVGLCRWQCWTAVMEVVVNTFCIYSQSLSLTRRRLCHCPGSEVMLVSTIYIHLGLNLLPTNSNF